MKKTLVALAVAAAAVAGSANAAVVYENDGAKVELSGSFRAFLGRVSDDKRGDLINNKSRVELKASQDLGNGLSALLGYEMRFNKNEDGKNKGNAGFDDPNTDKLFAGLKHTDIGTLTFGRQTTTGDDVLQDGAYYTSGENGILTTSAKKSVKFKSVEWNGFAFGADYIFGDSSKEAKSNQVLKNGFGLTGYYNYKIDEKQALGFVVGYTQANYEESTGSAYPEVNQKDKAWLAHVDYTYGPFYAALNYGQKLEDHKGESDVKYRYFLTDVSYQVTEPSKVYAQWERIDGKEKGSNVRDVENIYVVGADYKLHKNVVTYAEYAHKRTKDGADQETVKDNVYGVGLRVFF
ncbi:MAG: porin [[Actinobacillus] rossii]|nr:porin [[Actinobacillus] rossii]MDY5794157.1 porin [[Actinobacillus] rossii]